MVAQVHADVEEEMAADPLLGEVGWELADGGARPARARLLRAQRKGDPGDHRRASASRTASRRATGFELRASWCPGDDDFGGDVAAWCDLIAAAAGWRGASRSTGRCVLAGGVAGEARRGTGRGAPDLGH